MRTTYIRNVLVICLAAVLLVGCGAPAKPTPTATPAAKAFSPAVSRYEVQRPFEEAGFAFTGNGQGTDWHTGNIWNGSGASIDLFGPDHQIEAVEVWAMVNMEWGVQFASSADRVTGILCGEQYVKPVVDDWLLDGALVDELPNAGRQGLRRAYGRCAFHLALITDPIPMVMLSVEPK